MVKAYFLPHPSDQMSFTLPFKGATSLFAHLGKLGLNISNSTFVIRVDLLHPQPSLFLHGYYYVFCIFQIRSS